jgi:hypothetical protein
MARVKFGGLISDISGSVGGGTFQRSNYGSVLRSKPIPIHTFSSAQIIIRQHINYLHAQWSELSSEERNQWNKYILFSNPTIKRDKAVLLSGHDLFIKYNMLRLCRSLAILTTPTYITMPEVPGISQIFRSGGSIFLALNDAIDPDDLSFLLKVSTPRHQSVSFSLKGCRNMSYISGGPTNWDFAASYSSVFGFVAEAGDFIHLSLQFFSKLAPIYLSPQVGSFEVQ